MVGRGGMFVCACALAACGPDVDYCPLLESTPTCGSPVETEVIDPLGLSDETIAGVIDQAATELHELVGAYVIGEGGFYAGSMEIIESATGEVFATESAYATVSVHRTSLYHDETELLLRVGDFTANQAIAFRLEEDDPSLYMGRLRELPNAGQGSRSCGPIDVDLAARPPALRLENLECDDDDPETPPKVGRATLDLSRRPLDSVTFDDIVRANVMAYFQEEHISEFVPCGDGWVRELQMTYDVAGDRGRVYVDYHVTWFVKDDCPKTSGVAQVEILFAEECWCPEGAHCHGRIDEACDPWR